LRERLFAIETYDWFVRVLGSELRNRGADGGCVAKRVGYADYILTVIEAEAAAGWLVRE
jgi:hypothetical protein